MKKRHWKRSVNYALLLGFFLNLSTLFAQFNFNDGLVVHLPFDGNAKDQISGFEGIPGGNNESAPTLVADRFGKPESAYFFDNTIGQWITYDDRELRLPVGAEERTLSVWVKSDGPMNDAHLINYGARDLNQNCHIGVNKGIPRFGFWSDLDTDANTQIDDDQWHHIVGVLDGENMYIYVDAKLDTVRELGIFPETTLDPTNIMTIGIIGNYEWAPCHGSIDDVRIYDYSFYEDEVEALYHYSETSVKNQTSNTPSAFELGQNYPNPFNPYTFIPYTVSQSASVAIDILNLKGQTIATLIDEVHTPGEYTVQFDAGKYPSGIYYYRLKNGLNIQTKKLILMQ